MATIKKGKTTSTPKAKKAKKEEVKEAELDVDVKAETVVEESDLNTEPAKKIELPEALNNEPSKKWVMKDRVYGLKKGTPIAYRLKSRNIFYFDKEKGKERELMATTNLDTPFVDEFKDRTPRIMHLWFGDDSKLRVPKEKVALQKLLSLYHPDLNKVYVEIDPEAKAEAEMQELDILADALEIAKNADIEKLEAIVWAESGDKVDNLSSSEIKRDAKMLAKNDPKEFLRLAESDGLMVMRIASKGVKDGYINKSSDGRSFYWASTNAKICTVPYGEDPIRVIATHFLTDKGQPVLHALKRKLGYD